MVVIFLGFWEIADFHRTTLIFTLTKSQWRVFSHHTLSFILRFVYESLSDWTQVVFQSSFILIFPMIRNIKHLMNIHWSLVFLSLKKLCSLHLPGCWLALLFYYYLVSVVLYEFWTTLPCLKCSCKGFLPFCWCLHCCIEVFDSHGLMSWYWGKVLCCWVLLERVLSTLVFQR